MSENNKVNYSIGNNNIIKIRVEDSSNFTLSNDKQEDTTKIISNHTTLRELDEGIGVVKLETIADKELINQGKYQIKITYSNDTEDTRYYKYLKEEKNNYNPLKPTVLIDTMGRIYFNSPYKNFKDEYYKEFLVGKKNWNSKQGSVEIHKKGVYNSYNIINESMNRTKKDMNNLVMMLVKLASLKEEYKDNFQILNKYSEMWGETMVSNLGIEAEGPEYGSASVTESAFFFTNYQRDSVAIKQFFTSYSSDDVNDAINNVDTVKYQHGTTIEETLYLPTYFNDLEIKGLGSLYFVDPIKTIIVPENYNYLGTPFLGEVGGYLKFDETGKHFYESYPFTNITAGTRAYHNGDFGGDDYWAINNLSRSSVLSVCKNKNANIKIENLVVKSKKLLIGHWYLAGAHLDNLILDNENSEDSYNYTFDDSVTGSEYVDVDSYYFDPSDYNKNTIKTYIKHIDLTHNDFDNVIIEKIGEGSLKDCIDLETFPFDRVALTPMGAGAFYNCGFKTLNLNVRILNKEVFRDNIKLLSLNINVDNLRILNTDIINLTKTFKNCNALSKLTGLENVEEMIQTQTFKKCKSLDIDFTKYHFIKLGDATFAQTDITNLHSPTLERVGHYCFSNTKIRTIKAPCLVLNENLTDPIEEYAPQGVFSGCTDLTDVINLIPFEQKIPINTFSFCYKLNSISQYINQNVTIIDDNAFLCTAPHFLNSENFPNLEEIGEHAFYNNHIIYTDEDNTIKKEIRFLLPETVTVIRSESLHNINCVELYGPQVTDLIGERSVKGNISAWNPINDRQEIISYNMEPFIIYLISYGKINLPALEEFTVNGDSPKTIYLEKGIEEVYLDKLKYISKNVKFNLKDPTSRPFVPAIYFPQKIMYAPELTNFDAVAMISDTGALGDEKIISSRLDFFLPKWWQIKNYDCGFCSTSPNLERLVFGGNYASLVSVYNSDKLVTAELGGWYHGKMIFENNSALQTINTNLEPFPLVDPAPIPEDSYMYNSSLTFSNNPSLQEVNFPSENNPINLTIDGYYSHSADGIICRNYDKTTNLQTHTYILRCNPNLVQYLFLGHIALNGPEFDYINTLPNLNTLKIGSIGDYETSEFTLDNSNIELLTVLKDSKIASSSLKFNIKCKEDCTINLYNNGGTYILNNNLVNTVRSYTHDLVKGNSVTTMYIYKESSGGTVDMQKIDTILLNHPNDSKKVKIICPSVKRIENMYYRDGVYVDLTQMGYEDLEYVDTYSYDKYNTVWDLDRLIGKHFDNFSANVNAYIHKNKSNYKDEDDNSIIQYIGCKIYTKHARDYYFGPLDLVVTEATSYPWTKVWSYTSYTNDYKYINHVYLTREAYDNYFTENPNGQKYGQFIKHYSYGTIYEDDLDNPYIRCIDDL